MPDQSDVVGYLSGLIDGKIDIDYADVQGALIDGGVARQLAEQALLRTSLRRSLKYACALALHPVQSAPLEKTVTALLDLTDFREPYYELLKQRGIDAAHAGRIDRAMHLLQTAVGAAIADARYPDARSQSLMRFAHDADIGRAIKLLASPFIRQMSPNPRIGAPALLILCSALQDEDGPTIVTLTRMSMLRDLGFSIRVLSTELADSTQTAACRSAIEAGFEYVPIPKGTPRQRIAFALENLATRPADAILFEASGADLFAQLLAEITLAPVQAWANKGFEPQAGRFDIVAQFLTPDQERATSWPGVSKFYGAAIALGELIDRSERFSHAELGLTSERVVCGTFGRIEKCLSETYITGVSALLAAAPQATLVLAGPDTAGQMVQLMHRFAAAGVAEQVKYLGRRQQDAARLIKSLDVYLDTYPWPGGQSVQDAMWAGVPVVAMRKPDLRDLDPHGTNVSAVADVLLSGVMPLANSSEDYTELGLRLVRSIDERNKFGAALRRKAVLECNMREATNRLGADVLTLIDARYRV